jgi:2-furoyl-CoA dehydrogenase 2Fe-2S iron sulfur subunit
MREISVDVNGRRRSAVVPERLLASDFLRHNLGLRGTRVGCEHGVCGACTVRVDGAAMRSCLLLAVQLDGCRVDTVEGLAGSEGLGPLQDALHRHFALQCGYCTAGILMSAAELADDGGDVTADDVRDLLSGHICRCTGYATLVDALCEVLVDGCGEVGR